MTNDERRYWKYWGKARNKGKDGVPYHLLPYHCLDVAAVGTVYLENHPALRADWATRLYISEEIFTDWFVFFLSLHDLGKFSYRFQGLKPNLCKILENEQPEARYTHRHDTLGYLLWQEQIRPLAIEQAWFGAGSDRVWPANFDIWAGIVTGHHGQPPKPNDGYLFPEDHFSESDQEAATQFARDCADLLLPNRGLILPDGRVVHERLKPLSWWLAGLAVLCDWLGSNEAFFAYRTLPFDGTPPSLRDYWYQSALPQAKQALAQIGLIPRRVRPQTLTELFAYLNPPTPLQQTAADLPLADTPQLFILEDVTGAGKTEAALAVAHRIMQSGRADGFYFGLPTMATSNAMFRRLVDKGLDQKFFHEKPNRVLAHSASRLEPVLEALSSGGSGNEADYDMDDESAGNQRLTWFSDSRKKALLADIGVGTVDQALLAVLYTRHQSLRLLGLARKVLILDEVHACDAYMLKLLERLLEFHAAAGGSAILLSATLPRMTREKLAQAYRLGLERQAPALQSDEYPLLTRVGLEGSDEIALETRPEVARTVDVDWLHSVGDAVAVLLTARAENRCACWIRNTVDDAITAYEELRQAGIPSEDLLLFHARFVLGDRLGIEGRVLETFGPESKAPERRGKILICTQVVESSVDIDLDLMISDLAPVDLIIQRAGRLCRHVRDASGNRAQKDGRGTPQLWLLGPEFTEIPATAWLGDAFSGTAAVYPDHGRLWLTAKLLRQSGRLAMPGDARILIEGVYGEKSEAAIPAAFQAKTNKIEGDKSAKQTIASANTVKLEEGYENQGFEPWDDTLIPTRLEDQPSVTVRLARWEEGDTEPKPWVRAEKFAWELSQLSVRSSLFVDALDTDEKAIHDALDRCRQTMPDQGKWSKLLVLRRENGVWMGRGKNKKEDVVILWYDEKRGLKRLDEETQALLKILALGTRQIEAGKVQDSVAVIARLRNKGQA
jgi:CRISPR-associated endonuclease/helicase Cas3